PFCIVNVVVDLIRVPTEFKGSRYDGASRESRICVAYLYRSYAGSRIKTKLRIGRSGVDRRCTGRRCRIVTVEADAEGIQQLRAEDVAPFCGNGLALTLISDQLIVHLVGFSL